jgi:hypothetical protein
MATAPNPCPSAAPPGPGGVGSEAARCAAYRVYRSRRGIDPQRLYSRKETSGKRRKSGGTAALIVRPAAGRKQHGAEQKRPARNEGKTGEQNDEPHHRDQPSSIYEVQAVILESSLRSALAELFMQHPRTTDSPFETFSNAAFETGSIGSRPGWHREIFRHVDQSSG